MGEREDRFSLLARRNGDAVLRYIRNRYVEGDGIGAEDLLADVLSVAWKRLDEIPHDAERPWLFAIARNRLLNAKAKRARRNRILGRLRPPSRSAAAEDVALADLSVRDALARLPALECEALLLTAWEGLSPAELAVALDVSVNTAAVRLSRAKHLFIEYLQDGDSVSSARVTNRTE